MKKIIFLFLIFVCLFAVRYTLFPTPAMAQGPTNTFNCEWTGISCVANGGGCAPGFGPNNQTCESITSIGQCQTTINQPCISTTPPGTKYSCYVSLGGCQVDPNGAYTNFTTCQNVCSGTITTKFKCSNNQCVEAQNGTYTTADCNGACAAFAGLCTPTGGLTNSGIDTAIGCVPVLANDNGVAFYGFILKWAIGIAGGIAFLLIVYAGFMIMTSSGNPDRLKAGQELLTSAISGLILLVLSVFILDLIGVKILRLPGLPQ